MQCISLQYPSSNSHLASGIQAYSPHQYKPRDGLCLDHPCLSGKIFAQNRTFPCYLHTLLKSTHFLRHCLQFFKKYLYYSFQKNLSCIEEPDMEQLFKYFPPKYLLILQKIEYMTNIQMGSFVAFLE